MPVDLYTAEGDQPTYFDYVTEVGYVNGVQQTQITVTATRIDLGPIAGIPDTSHYVNSDGEISENGWALENGYQDDVTGNTRNVAGAPGPAPSAGLVQPGGGSPTNMVTIGDGSVVSPPLLLDVVIREGIKFSGNEQFTESATARELSQSSTNVSWSNLSSLYFDTGEATSVSLTSGQTSSTIQFSVFDVDIPPGAVVTGFKVTINRTIISGSVTETGQIQRCAVQ